MKRATVFGIHGACSQFRTCETTNVEEFKKEQEIEQKKCFRCGRGFVGKHGKGFCLLKLPFGFNNKIICLCATDVDKPFKTQTKIWANIQ